MFKVLFNILTTTLFCIVFFIMFSVNALAETESAQATSKKEVVTYFGWTTSDLNEMVTTGNTSIFNSPVYSITEIENYRKEVLKDLGSLQLTNGYSRDRITTFSKTKSLSGAGSEGTVVGLYVFHYESTSSAGTQLIVPTQDHLVTIGKSGLYSETININYVGSNYVLLASKNPKTMAITYRLFKVTLKEEETRDKLENVTINFFEDTSQKTNVQELVPSISNYGF
jgi:hypothetical protein